MFVQASRPALVSTCKTSIGQTDCIQFPMFCSLSSFFHLVLTLWVSLFWKEHLILLWWSQSKLPISWPRLNCATFDYFFISNLIERFVYKGLQSILPYISLFDELLQSNIPRHIVFDHFKGDEFCLNSREILRSSFLDMVWGSVTYFINSRIFNFMQAHIVFCSKFKINSIIIMVDLNPCHLLLNNCWRFSTICSNSVSATLK